MKRQLTQSELERQKLLAASKSLPVRQYGSLWRNVDDKEINRMFGVPNSPKGTGPDPSIEDYDGPDTDDDICPFKCCFSKK